MLKSSILPVQLMTGEVTHIFEGQEEEVQVGPAGECVLCEKNYDLCGLTRAGMRMLPAGVLERLESEVGERLRFPLIVCNSWYGEEGACTPTVDCPNCKKAACDHNDTTCWSCGFVLPERVRTLRTK